jgi:hypothetical protein
VGLEMVAPIGLGAAIDYYCGWRIPWATLTGVVLGFAGGFYHLLALSKRLDEGDKGPKNPEKP